MSINHSYLQKNDESCKLFMLIIDKIINRQRQKGWSKSQYKFGVSKTFESNCLLVQWS